MGSNNARETFCRIPDAERCSATVELHKGTTIQGWRLNEPGRCLRRHKAELVNQAGESAHFCTTHKRMALEGKVSAQGGGHAQVPAERLLHV